MERKSDRMHPAAMGDRRRQLPDHRLYTLLPLAGAIAFVALAGLSCTRLGERVNMHPLPPGAPALAQVLQGLAENEAAIRSFRATGTVMLQLPEIEATQVSRESLLHYRAPDALHVIGRRYGTRFVELTHGDNAFLLEFPTRREYCFQPAEEEFTTLSSADIVREMFRPEQWQALSERKVRMLAYDGNARTAVLQIDQPRNEGPQRSRTVTVQGLPWVVLETKLFDGNGQIIAHTTKADYHELDGVRYPTQIESVFPGENAWMRFSMRRVDMNIDLDPVLFDIPAKLAVLHGRGFTRVDIFAGEGSITEDLRK